MNTQPTKIPDFAKAVVAHGKRLGLIPGTAVENQHGIRFATLEDETRIKVTPSGAYRLADEENGDWEPCRLV